jgi:hypothetical protein
VGSDLRVCEGRLPESWFPPEHVAAQERIGVAEMIELREIQLSTPERDLRARARQAGCQPPMAEYGMGEISALVVGIYPFPSKGAGWPAWCADFAF